MDSFFLKKPQLVAAGHVLLTPCLPFSAGADSAADRQDVADAVAGIRRTRWAWRACET